MPNILVKKEVDIYVLPELDTVFCGGDGAEVTIGDLHGNMLKLLFLLIRQGIATNLSGEDYAKLVAIYTKLPDEITEQDLSDFNALMDGIIFNRGMMVRLIGDELADRGSNDYFTLKLLEKLHQNQVPFEILLSNHGIEFVQAYETQQHFHAPMLRNGHADSMEALQVLVEKGLVLREEVLSIAHEAYKHALRVLSYSLSEDNSRITIYSHAGIGLNSIQELAVKVDVPYLDGSAKELAQTIDQLNSKFQSHVQVNTVHTLYQRAKMEVGYSGYNITNAPFEFIMWNRFYHHLNRPECHLGYEVEFVHGHDSSDETERNIYNLDNNLGKRVAPWKDNHRGVYSILYASGVSLSLPLIEWPVQGTLALGPSVEQRAEIHPASEPMYAFWLQFGAGLFAAASLVSLCVVAAAFLGVVSLSIAVFDGALLFGAVTGILSLGFFKAIPASKEPINRDMDLVDFSAPIN